MKQLRELLSNALQNRLSRLNLEREKDGLPRLSTLKVKILGQMALSLNNKASNLLHIAQTLDVDAWLEGDFSARNAFKDIIKEIALVYDELSSEIWIPDNAKFEKIIESPELVIEILDPIAALTSKAVKAPNKNKILIVEALAVYGEQLAEEIIRYGGDLNFFIEEE